MMDWDVDMEDTAADGFSIDPPTHPTTATTPSTQEVLAVEHSGSQMLAPSKIYIQGLDTMSTDDVKALVAEHFGPVNRVEWINDESANIVFSSESVAQDALLALSVVPIADPTSLPAGETVPAKPPSSKPDVSLHIRFALASDKKKPGAAARSRYYLFHPDQDPEERRRQRERRYRDRDGDNLRSSRRRPRSDDDVVETYDAGMYDDDDAALADRAAKPRQSKRARSRDLVDRPSERSRNQDKELFPNRNRNRSASPLRDGDGDARMEADTTTAGTSSNRRAASGLKDRLNENNSLKELFPAKTTSSKGGHMDRLNASEETTRLLKQSLNVNDEDQGDSGDPFSIRGIADRKSRQTGFAIKGAASAKVTELFPDKFGPNRGKELFADRTEGRPRLRKKAEDLFY